MAPGLIKTDCPGADIDISAGAWAPMTDNVTVLLKLSHYYRINDTPDLKNRQLALEKAQRAVELYPEDPGAWILVSFALLELNEREKAVEAMRQAADYTANRGDRAHCLANAFWFQGENAEAAEQFLNAAQWGDKNPSVMYARRGLCLN